MVSHSLTSLSVISSLIRTLSARDGYACWRFLNREQMGPSIAGMASHSLDTQNKATQADFSKQTLHVRGSNAHFNYDTPKYRH